MTVFDGHELDSAFVVVEPDLQLPSSEVDTYDVPARDGQAVAGRRWGPARAALTLVVEGEPGERRRKLSALAHWLDVDGPRPLSLDDLPGLHWMAVPEGALDVARYVGATSVRVGFLIPDPVAYGAERSAVVPSGGSARLLVGGTYPTRPTISASATRSASSGVWGVRLDGGDFLHVATGSASAREVELDCAGRTCLVAGAVSLPTLDSDWLELSPGEHVLSVDEGSGSAVVRWTERWL